MVRRSPLVVPVLLAGLLAPPAAAEPATTVRYPAGAAATVFAGRAFDTCTAPSLAAVRAWGASPYRAVGVYVGGANRTCSQPELTPGWVASVSALGWRLLPVYKGRQPACGGKPTDLKITATRAAHEGRTAGADAVGRARALGMLPGSALYLDIESYSPGDTACRTAVLRFVSGYVKELHRVGYLAGVYANLSSGARHLSDAYGSTAYARPDALWVARWDSSPSLTGWAGIPDTRWAVHQRAKQYRGDHTESHGGVTLNVDSDQLDAPVATVAHPYRVTSSTPLNARTAPRPTAPLVRSYPPGTTVRVVCQTIGSRVGTTAVWDKLPDGSYVTDLYVGTPSSTSWSRPLPRCYFPYQVTAGLTERTGPGSGYPAAGTLPAGSLAYVSCQRSGSRVGTTSVWDRLADGRWVSDAYVATPSATTWSPPVPRC